MNPSIIRRLRHAAAGDVRVGLVMALAAGIVDVAMALLQQPRDFGHVTALAPPILATAAALFAVNLALWTIVARLCESRLSRVPGGRRAAAAAVAALLLSAFTLTVLLGLHLAPWSAHTLFRAFVVLVLSAFIAIGTYALQAAAARHDEADRYSVAIAQAVPLLLFEVLAYEWLQVYAIDSITSLASLVASVALIATAGATLAVFVVQRRTRMPARMLAAFTILLLVAPLVRVGRAAIGAGITASAAIAPSAANADSTARVSRPIVLISVDTLRADALSSYRTGGNRTPAIDRLAADGLVFENAIAPSPWTLPSMASILTGLSPSVHLATDVTSRLSDAVTTLAERLTRAGYHTAAIVHNDLLHPTSNLAQGFASYRSIYEPSYGGSVGASLLQALLPAAYPPPSWPTTQDHTALAIEWLETNRRQDFLFWIHYRDPHAPYTPPREYLRGQPPGDMGFEFEGQELISRGFVVPSGDERQWIRALYDAEARHVDANIARLVETLKRTNLYDQALIILTSDHGEEFWEHGGQGHGHSMNDELLKVPLIMKLPRSSRRGRVTTAVATESVTPTVLEVSRIRHAEADFSAPSLLRLVASDNLTPDNVAPRPVVSTAQILFDRREAVRAGGFKYIRSQIDGHEELFELGRDPGERHPVTTSALDALEMGRAALKQHHQQSAALRKRLGIQRSDYTVDEDTLRRLRTLGYVH